VTRSLVGRVAIVTGGGRNIGRQICLTLAQHGCDVVVNVRTDLAAAESVAAEVEALGRRALPIVADVSDRAAVEALVERTRARFGRIDVLVNNAGIYPHVPFLELTEAMWQEVLAVDLSGPLYACRAVLPSMLAQGSGSIITISGTVVFYGSWAYLAAAKGGLHGLTRGIAREFGPKGIRANIVVPSTIETLKKVPQPPERVAAEIARTPLGRLGEVREVADVCAFLASDESSYITGQSLHVNGGQFMP
jgi:3-oxoacyl-[acyl-carrier protein] reductase